MLDERSSAVLTDGPNIIGGDGCDCRECDVDALASRSWRTADRLLGGPIPVKTQRRRCCGDVLTIGKGISHRPGIRWRNRRNTCEVVFVLAERGKGGHSPRLSIPMLDEWRRRRM